MGISEGLWSISDGIIRDVAIASNGQQVLLGLSNGKAIYINLATGRRLEFLAHREKLILSPFLQMVSLPYLEVMITLLIYGIPKLDKYSVP